jgi:hypothetical protein
MHLRRAFALAMALLVFHLSLVAAGTICHAGTAPASQQKHHSSMHATHSMATEVAKCADLNEAMPVDCCTGMVSCGAYYFIDAQLSTAIATYHRSPSTPDVDGVISRIPAPDPPPPKA